MKSLIRKTQPPLPQFSHFITRTKLYVNIEFLRNYGFELLRVNFETTKKIDHFKKIFFVNSQAPELSCARRARSDHSEKFLFENDIFSSRIKFLFKNDNWFENDNFDSKMTIYVHNWPFLIENDIFNSRIKFWLKIGHFCWQMSHSKMTFSARE